MHDNGSLVICPKQGINGFLVFHAAVTVIHHNLCFHTCRLHIFVEMVHDIPTYIIYTLVCCEEGFHACATHKLILVFLANLVGKRIKLLLEFCFVQMHLHRHRLEVQFKRCAIGYRILECIL